MWDLSKFLWDWWAGLVKHSDFLWDWVGLVIFSAWSDEIGQIFFMRRWNLSNFLREQMGLIKLSAGADGISQTFYMSIWG